MILCFTLNCIITLCVSTAHHSLYDAEVRKISSLIRACFAYIGLGHVGYILNNRVSKSTTIHLLVTPALCRTSQQGLTFSITNEWRTAMRAQMVVYSFGLK
jgi:hypothetical protein